MLRTKSTRPRASWDMRTYGTLARYSSVAAHHIRMASMRITCVTSRVGRATWVVPGPPILVHLSATRVSLSYLLLESLSDSKPILLMHPKPTFEFHPEHGDSLRKIWNVGEIQKCKEIAVGGGTYSAHPSIFRTMQSRRLAP